MISIKRMTGCSLALAFLLLAPFQAKATVVCTLDDVYTGATPLGSAPWLQAVFTDAAPGHVLLTLTALNLQGGEYVSNWYFNLNPAKIVANLTFTYVSGIHPTSYTKNQNGINADGVHGFDFRISEPTYGNTFGSGDTTVIDISGISGLTAADFNALVTQGNETYLASARVKNIPVWDARHHCYDYEDAYVGAEAADPPAHAPEPASLLLGGLGLGMLAVARKRTRKNTG